MRFWDSSALVPLFVLEPRSERAGALRNEDTGIVVAWTASIECASAFVRRHRERAISDAQLVALLGRLRDFSSQWSVAEPTPALHTSAERIVARHALRAADAVQLASALAAAAGGTLDFVCFDDRLALAATSEGLQVVSS